MPKFIPDAAHPPDICVPNCDSHLRCPPNFFCYKKNSGPANPPICIPGLLGFVCGSDVDCLMGRCQTDNDPPDHGLSLCTIPCARDSDCDIYDSQQGRFVCSQDGRCVTPEAYRGASCNTTDDCSRDIGTVCVWPPSSPPTPNNPRNQGTCLRPCDPTTFSCTARGGIGHTCLPFVGKDLAKALVCYPGYFGYPCFTSTACAVEELKCIGMDLSDMNDPKPGICTITGCAVDNDCRTNRWTEGNAYCVAGVCSPLIADGESCDLDAHCASGTCATGVCAAALQSGGP